MVIFAPAHQFLYKYFDRAFDREIVETPVKNDLPAVIITAEGAADTSELQTFRKSCHELGLRLITLHVPAVIGTGMGSPTIDLVRNIARGTLFKIKDNSARWSLIHAVDVPEAVKYILANNTSDNHILQGKNYAVNDLIDALAFRMNNRKVGTVSDKWGRVLHSKRLYQLMTGDMLTSAVSPSEQLEGFDYTDVTEYLKTHVYDDESL